MSELLWFDGITWETPVNQVGWIWLLLFLLIFATVWSAYSLIKSIRGNHD